MNERSAMLLDGVVPGDYISIVYGGQSTLFAAEGYVQEIRDPLLILTRKNIRRESRVLLDLLASVTLLDPPEEQSLPGPVDQRTASKPLSQTDTQTVSAPKALQPGRRVQPLPAAEPWQPDLQEQLAELRSILKNLTNKTVRNGLNAVLDSLKDAARNGSVQEKYQTLRAKVLTLWNDCSSGEDYYAFYLQLGLLAISAEDHLHAVEPLVRSRHYALAAYAAGKAQREDYQELLTICALLAGEEQVRLDQSVVDILWKRQDVQPLFQLLEQHEGEEDYAEALLSCAWALCVKQGCAGDVRLEENFSAAKAARLLLNAMPLSWRTESRILKKWNTYDQYSYPLSHAAQSQEGDWITGTILSYKPEKRFGFIQVNGMTDNVYFYIKQVAAEEPNDLFLRNLLAQGKAVGLEVSFSLGESPTRKGQCSANDIYLTQKGYDDAVALLIAERNPVEETGYIAEYPNDAGFGRLYVDGKPCNYLLDSVVDPFLHAYLSNHISADSFQEQEVLFQTEYRGNKPTAQRIRWKNPRPMDVEAIRSLVSEDSASLWEEYRKALEAEQSPDAPLVLPNREDPYPTYPFELLPDWVTVPDDKSDRPLTWKISTGGEQPKSAETPVKSTVPPAVSIPSTAPAAPDAAAPNLSGEARQLAERGRHAILKGDLSDGETLLLKALERGAPAELLVGDLVSLYLRLPEKLPDALALLERYQKQLAPEKLLNMKISIYDKQKNAAAICPLYEESFRLATTPSRKSHSLFRLLGTYLETNQFQKALEVCDRWKALYQQSRTTPDAQKLQNAAPNVARKEAVCLCHLGRFEEARVIAARLLTLNPADEIALEIQNGTLVGADGELLFPQATPAEETAEVPAPVAEAPVATEEAVPVEETPAAEGAAAPVEDVPVPAEDVAPVEETTAPIAENPAGAEEGAAPAEADRTED